MLQLRRMTLRATLSIAVVVSACASAPRHKDEVLALPLTSATSIPNDDAIRLLARSRCKHEAECGHIGSGAQFPTLEACADTAILDERSSVGLDACPYGVAEERLDRCARTIDALPCSSRMTALTDVTGCTRMELCR
jgi:hypothetical protein